MSVYEIIETEAGLTVVELAPETPPEETASRYAGVVVDPGPYKTYDEACDALLALRDEEEEEEVDLR